MKGSRQNHPETPAPLGAPVAPVEWMLGGAVVVLLAFACAGPFVGQPAAYHAFADQRTFLGIPFALDVLSNLPFAAWGVAGILLARFLVAGGRAAPAPSRAQGWSALLFFSGLVLTAACSAWYHLNPADAGLAIDRCGMARNSALITFKIIVKNF